MTPNLTGLSLRRKACEVLEIWHPHTVNHDEQQASQDDLCILCHVARHSHDNGMPAIESDPAVALPMLVEFCEKNDWFFTLTNSSLNGPFKVTMFTHEDGSQFSVTGSTPCEAIARAIIQAHGQGV